MEEWSETWRNEESRCDLLEPHSTAPSLHSLPAPRSPAPPRSTYAMLGMQQRERRRSTSKSLSSTIDSTRC